MHGPISWHLRLHGPQPVADLRVKFGVQPGPRPFPPYDEVLGFLEDVDESLDLVVPLVDGRLSHVLSLFDGLVLTDRVTAHTTGRHDLWASPSLAPLIDLVAEAPLALADGGQLERSPVHAQVLLGPSGWLPDARPGQLLAFRIDSGVVRVAVATEVATDDASVRRVRNMLARHTTYDDMPDSLRRIDITHSLAIARQEAPDLLSAPTLPLQEVLHEPIDDRRPEMWRDLMAWRQDETVSFSIEGMPEALYRELNGRALHYGMSVDQFVIAVLGHLAWRTPFTEDMAPYESWVTDQGEPPPRLRSVETTESA